MLRVRTHRLQRRLVGLNAHLLSLAQTYRSAGINSYIHQLLNHLPALDKTTTPFDYVAFLHDPAYHPPAGLNLVRSRWNTASPWRRIAWEQTQLAHASRQLDLLHGMAFASPLLTVCPTVISVHDLSFLRFPDAFPRFNRTYLSFITRMSARRARRVIVASESTRQDVIQLCHVASERVVNVPDGVDAAFTPAPAAEISEFRRRKGLPERFLLFVGTLEPRKNLPRLIAAYARIRTSETPPLVVAGGKGWFYESIFAEVQRLGLANAVFFPGFIPADELPWWYRAAELFVFPSRFEGFGLPVLEAMACGVPVITSTASSLPEVAGDAALLVSPDDAEALAEALAHLLADAALREDLRIRGLAQARQYSWERTARETADVYLAALGLDRQETTQ